MTSQKLRLNSLGIMCAWTVVVFVPFVTQAAHAAVFISAVGGGTGYDETGAAATDLRSTNIAKSFEPTGGYTVPDNAYGTAGSWFVGNGAASSPHTDNSPAWATNFSAGTQLAGNAGYTSFDDPTQAIGPGVTDWAFTSFTGYGSAAGWNTMLSFDITASTPDSFRLGLVAGNEQTGDGRWDPEGLRLSFDGGTAVEVTGLPVTALGMVFFDIQITDSSTGTFLIEGNRRNIGANSRGSALAGVTFDFAAVPEPSTALLLGVGLVGLAMRRRRFSRRQSPRIVVSVVTLLVVTSVATATQAAILVGYDFTTNTVATTVGDGATASNVTGGGGFTDAGIAAIGDITGLAASGTTFGSTSTGSYGDTNGGIGGTDLASAITGNDYMTFTATADPGRSLFLTGFSVDTARASDKAPESYNILAQVNGGSTWLAANALTTDQTTLISQGTTDWHDTFIDLSGNSMFQNIDSVEFRIYFWGASGTTSSSRINIDQLLVEGSAVVPEPSTALLLGLGLVGLVMRRRRRTTNTSMAVALLAISLVFASTASAQAAIVAGDVVSIDFGNNNSPATPNWNEYNSGSGTLSNLIRISDGAGTGVDLAVTGIDGDGSNHLLGSGSSSSTIFEDHIFGNGATNDTLTFTISGLNDGLTYDLFGGFIRNSAAFEHTWDVGGDLRTNTFGGGNVDGYETFTGLSSTAGVITFTITDLADADIASIAELTITANAVIPEPSTALLLGLGLVGIACHRRRRARR